MTTTKAVLWLPRLILDALQQAYLSRDQMNALYAEGTDEDAHDAASKQWRADHDALVAALVKELTTSHRDAFMNGARWMAGKMDAPWHAQHSYEIENEALVSVREYVSRFTTTTTTAQPRDAEGRAQPGDNR
jgi:hypothetical protein